MYFLFLLLFFSCELCAMEFPASANHFIQACDRFNSGLNALLDAVPFVAEKKGDVTKTAHLLHMQYKNIASSLLSAYAIQTSPLHGILDKLFNNMDNTFVLLQQKVTMDELEWLSLQRDLLWEALGCLYGSIPTHIEKELIITSWHQRAIPSEYVKYQIDDLYHNTKGLLNITNLCVTDARRSEWLNYYLKKIKENPLFEKASLELPSAKYGFLKQLHALCMSKYFNAPEIATLNTLVPRINWQHYYICMSCFSTGTLQSDKEEDFVDHIIRLRLCNSVMNSPLQNIYQKAKDSIPSCLKHPLLSLWKVGFDYATQQMADGYKIVHNKLDSVSTSSNDTQPSSVLSIALSGRDVTKVMQQQVVGKVLDTVVPLVKPAQKYAEKTIETMQSQVALNEVTYDQFLKIFAVVYHLLDKKYAAIDSYETIPCSKKTLLTALYGIERAPDEKRKKHRYNLTQMMHTIPVYSPEKNRSMLLVEDDKGKERDTKESEDPFALITFADNALLVPTEKLKKEGELLQSEVDVTEQNVELIDFVKEKQSNELPTYKTNVTTAMTTFADAKNELQKRSKAVYALVDQYWVLSKKMSLWFRKSLKTQKNAIKVQKRRLKNDMEMHIKKLWDHEIFSEMPDDLLLNSQEDRVSFKRFLEGNDAAIYFVAAGLPDALEEYIKVCNQKSLQLEEKAVDPLALTVTVSTLWSDRVFQQALKESVQLQLKTFDLFDAQASKKIGLAPEKDNQQEQQHARNRWQQAFRFIQYLYTLTLYDFILTCINFLLEVKDYTREQFYALCRPALYAYAQKLIANVRSEKQAGVDVVNYLDAMLQQNAPSSY